MKRTKKIMTLAIAAMLLVSTTVAVTVAYLTAETEVVTNTFTVGNVEIMLDEAQVDLYGTPSEKTESVDAQGNEVITWKAVELQAAPRVTANKYKLIPNHTYTKDPTVYVETGSEECYVFVKVENGLEEIESKEKSYVSIADQMTKKEWIPLEVDGEPVENVFYYKTTIDTLGAAERKSLIVFETFTIDSEAELTDENNAFKYKDAEITIDAYAIQADGFDSAADAWAAAAPSSWE